MPKPRGREHTSLTETALLVVRELEKLPGIKMVAPGMIEKSARGGSGQRYVTAVYTAAGMELIITGQSVQKVAIHTDADPRGIFKQLRKSKRLREFIWQERERFPEI